MIGLTKKNAFSFPKRYLFVLSVLFCSFSTFSQDSNLGVSQNVNRLATKTAMLYDAEKAYLMKDWQVGKVFFYGTTAKTENILINYNAFNERLERLQDNRPFSIEQPVRAFILGDTTLENNKGYLFKNGFEPIDNQVITSFYQSIFEGKKVTLLKYAKFKARETRGMNEANTTVSFDLYETFYVADAAKRLQKIKKNKKSILELFPEKSNELAIFIEKESLKFKEWDDVVKVLAFLDTL
jgi:hypothetical protein